MQSDIRATASYGHSGHAIGSHASFSRQRYARDVTDQVCARIGDGLLICTHLDGSTAQIVGTSLRCVLHRLALDINVPSNSDLEITGRCVGCHIMIDGVSLVVLFLEPPSLLDRRVRQSGEIRASPFASCFS